MEPDLSSRTRCTAHDPPHTTHRTRPLYAHDPPQVFETATRLLSKFAVPSLQFELSKGSVPSANAYTRALKPQVCMNLRLLVYLDR